MATDAKLTIEDLIQLEEIFTNKHWKKKYGGEIVFDLLSDMIAYCSDKEKELLFSLCNRYLWMSMPEYTENLLLTLDQVSVDRIKGITTIFLFPIVKKKDIHKIKSASSIIYNFKMAHFGGVKFKNVEFRIIDSFKMLENAKLQDDHLLFLVDDFIGTGKTLDETLELVKINQSILPSKISVISLVIQEETAKKLNEQNIDLYYFCTVKKGISDYYNDEELSEKTKTMESLEKLIPDVKDNKFGFGRSEALVTMVRTPNNTFPIFWKSHRRAGKYIKPPFPRNYER